MNRSQLNVKCETNYYLKLWINILTGMDLPKMEERKIIVDENTFEEMYVTHHVLYHVLYDYIIYSRTSEM